MSDFAGHEYDFAAGSLKGLRGWNMDKFGRLHGVTHEEVWRPGENVSICKQERQIACPKKNLREEARKASEAGRAKVEKKKRKGRDPIRQEWLEANRDPSGYWPAVACGDPACVNGRYHIVGSGHRFDPDCRCGFWAYDEAGFRALGTVVGVIEGYGKTTVGTKGFRCEKARIVAISCENGEGVRHSRSMLARLAALYPDVAFVENLDALIDEHSEVLRTWPEVGDDFWLQPVEPKREEWSAVKWATSLTVPASSFTFYPGGSIA